MQSLTPQSQQQINEIAQRYGLTVDAVMTMFYAVVNGNGTMAQFNHPELGGSGQWMQGGMTMVGDMFNNNLKALVDNLCNELSNLLASQPFEPIPQQSQGQGTGQNASLFVPMGSGNWWPDELGLPNGSGAQNNVRYAYFNQAQRLALEVNGQVTIYDTLNHQIGGVSQQQAGSSTLTFTSQYGLVDLTQLPIVLLDGQAQPPPTSNPPANVPQSPPLNQPPPTQPIEPKQPPTETNQPLPSQPTDILATIEQLSQLRDKGILTEEEFSTKKAELLARL